MSSDPMAIARAALVGLVVVALVAALHVTLKWMSRRGWIFYGGETPAPIGSRSAMALMEFESLFNPPIEHVLEYRRHGDLWVQEESEPDRTDSDQ